MTSVAGVVALVALATVLVALGYLHLAPTGLSPVRNAVSQYGITRFRAGYRVATIAFAVAGIALAVGIDRVASKDGREEVVVLLLLFALARGAISWFPMDAPGAARTSTGQVHGLLALVAFASAATAALRLGTVLSHGARWRPLAPVSSALGWAMVACLLGILFARSFPSLRARFGAIERGFYVSAIAWFAVFASACAANTH
ncbi:MAG: DUF998 domain-containing protein [Acidimicrobiales bacterium]|jgi:hypothetical protein